MTIKYNKDGWAVQVNKTDRGCVYEFQRQFTLSGAAENFDLSVPFPFELNRIEYFSDDATAKSFTERILSGNVTAGSYDEIMNEVNNIDIPVAYVPTGSEGVYTQSPLIIRTAMSASTAAKLLTKKVILRRLS